MKLIQSKTDNLQRECNLHYRNLRQLKNEIGRISNRDTQEHLVDALIAHTVILDGILELIKCK